MIDPFILDILLEVLKALLGVFTSVIIPALTVWLMFRTKRMNDNAKMRSLENKIGLRAQQAENLKSFQGMTIEERIEALMQAARREATDYGVSISEIELRIIVEKSLQSIRTLENIGHYLKLKKERMDEYIIKE